MNTKDIISCILPTYNRPEWLRKSLRALKEQNFDNFELIIVDDGSSPENKKQNIQHIREYERYIDIIYIDIAENSGTVSIPRNIGISYSTGKVISHLDDDCLVRPNKFNLLYPLLNEQVVLAYGGRATFIQDGESFILKGVKSTDLFSKHKYELGLDNGQFIYKASVYEKMNPVFAINACDWETYKQVANYGQFAYTPEIVCSYYWHGSNISLTPKNKRINPISKLKKYLNYFHDGPFYEKVYYYASSNTY